MNHASTRLQVPVAIALLVLLGCGVSANWNQPEPAPIGGGQESDDTLLGMLQNQDWVALSLENQFSGHTLSILSDQQAKAVEEVAAELKDLPGERDIDAALASLPVGHEPFKYHRVTTRGTGYIGLTAIYEPQSEILLPAAQISCVLRPVKAPQD